MIVGMDFGTTNSGMSVYDGERLRLIPLDTANANPHVARTAMYITNDREIFIGRGAIEAYYAQNLNRPFQIERIRVGDIQLTFAEVGTYYRDVFIEKDILAPGRLFLSFKMGLPSLDYLGTLVESHYYFLEDIIALYLYITRRRAEAHLGQPVTEIVLGRPVKFSDTPQEDQLAQERLLASAFRAGYERVYLQHEPIAAAYFYETQITQPENVLIFDFGGGTLDISIMRIGDGHQQILATGGIPIAGDKFDSKIVQSKFPRHFGEGSTYRDHGRDLPVPANFYTVFSSWQDILTLQMPDRLAILEHIARTASQRYQLNSLIKLVKSNYALKMFDVAEQAKRSLTTSSVTPLKLTDGGFMVLDRLTRAEFERIIRNDVQAIGDRLDEVIASAGLQPDQIDTVIRTGGSSLIPVFVEMLESRFGADKVRDIDTFSSVTSGLGVIAHKVKHGELDLPCYTSDTFTGGAHLVRSSQGGVPTLDIDRMKRFLDLREVEQPDTFGNDPVLLTLGEDDHLHTIAVDDVNITATTPAAPALCAASAAGRVVIATTDYRFFVRTARKIDDARRIDLPFEQTESFREDAFSRERVTLLHPWDNIETAEMLLFVSTLGYGRLIPAASILDKLNTPVPYQLRRTRGYPAALTAVQPDTQVILITGAGRAVRLPYNHLSRIEERLIAMPLKQAIVSAIVTTPDASLLLATASGYAKRLRADAIPLTTELNTTGAKIATRANTIGLIPANTPAYAVTTQRLLALNPADVPATGTDQTDHKIINLRKGEQVISLVSVPVSVKY